MLIRKVMENDFADIYNVVKEAFSSAEHTDGNEHNLVNALRAGDAYIPELSLLAEVDGKIIGHIMFSKIKIGNSTEVALAPLSVLPEYQNRGVGTKLVKAAHDIARQLGYHYSVVLGSEEYYPRFGYIPASKVGIKAPFEVSEENYMVFELNSLDNKIEGTVQYSPEFGI